MTVHNKLARLLSHTTPFGECLEWQGATDRHGYGRVSRVTYGESLAHRAVYRHAIGPVPEGLGLLHECDNPRCVNPKHLTPGTQLENMNDAKLKGVRLGETPKKVSDEVLVAILSRLAKGEKQREIAQAYGISEGYLSSIKHGNKRNS